MSDSSADGEGTMQRVQEYPDGGEQLFLRKDYDLTPTACHRTCYEYYYPTIANSPIYES